MTGVQTCALPISTEIAAPFTAFPLDVEFDETNHVSKITFNSYMFHADASVLK